MSFYKAVSADTVYEKLKTDPAGDYHFSIYVVAIMVWVLLLTTSNPFISTIRSAVIFGTVLSLLLSRSRRLTNQPKAQISTS